MKRSLFFFGIMLICMALTACESGMSQSSSRIPGQDSGLNGGAEMKIHITAGNRTFTATLQDNPSTRVLATQFPLTLDMSELNGNEKYYYLSGNLPTASGRVGAISNGDLMLYGSNCLVLFYESFSTSYSYTRLGRIEDPSGLRNALGRGPVRVTFEILQ